MPFSRNTNRCTASLAVTWLVGGFGSLCAAEVQMAVEIPVDTTLLSAVLAADNRRDGSEESLATLLAGSQAADQLTRRIAVRALGRVELPEWIPHIRSALSAEMHEVRQEAIYAIGQAAWRRGGASALDALESRVAVERHPAVLGALARTIGWLPLDSADVQRGEAAILHVLERRDTTPRSDRTAVMLGVAAGLEALARRTRGAGALRAETAQALRELTRVGLASNSPVPSLEAARVRRLATAALVTRGPVDQAFFGAALADPDPGVRRVAFRGLGSLPRPEDRSEIIMRAPMDTSWSVRYEILRAYGQHVRASMGCAPVVDGLSDPNPHVFLLALDLLGDDCPVEGEVARIVRSLVTALPANRLIRAGWQFPAHALVALARMAPVMAREFLPLHATHPQWQVRMYAATAAGVIGEDSVLAQLAGDPHHNVAEAALRVLHELRGHDADHLYLLALAASDYQLLRTAAQAIGGTAIGSSTVTPLLDALARVTADRKDTSRDARVALLTRIGELGDAEDIAQVQGYLTDFDPVVADSAAALLTRWTGQAVRANPQPLAPYPVPSIATLAELDGAVVHVELRDGATFELALRAFDAPTNAARFAQLVMAGYYDGLSFHRVEPNFVIQGGSPGANEYAGDGPYTRDELTDAAHWRGTVGVSTRGRNTGDGQIFVNLVDNVRLDRNYTIFGEVVRGMDTVDAILEGAEIERMTIARKDR